MEAFSERYDRALSLAARAHRGQTRKGSDVPYLVHPVHVSTLLLRHGFGEDAAVAGLLHDVVEDSDVPVARIEAEFGPAVAEIVAALTERKREGDRKRPWEIRKREALELLQAGSAEAVAVKAADVVHNARSMVRELGLQGPAIWDHYSRGPEESLWYYRRVAAIVRKRWPGHALTGELDRAVEALARAIAETGDT